MITDLDDARHIIRYFSKYMTEAESMAWRHWNYEFKMSSYTEAENHLREARIRTNIERGTMTTDPDVLSLLSEGIDQFRLRAANRILSEHGDEIDLNTCPKCHGLARTPQAKQCRHCGFDWH